jgi:hypothetical protein
MQRIAPPHHRSLVVLFAFAAALACVDPAHAQTAQGQAQVIQANIAAPLGTITTVLSSTGTLSDAGDAREASQLAGNIPALLTASTLHAATIGRGDRVASEASLADLAVTAAGNSIGADFLMTRASAVQGAASSASVEIVGLAINGLPVAVSGQPNQIVAIPGGRVVINEQQSSAGAIVANALHVVIDGVADVIVASATAGLR